MDYIHAIHSQGKKASGIYGWLLFLGIANILLGIAAATFSYYSTILSMLYLGWLLIFSGIGTGYLAFKLKDIGGHSSLLIFCTLAVVCGTLMLISPMVNAEILTALVAVYLFTFGLVTLSSCIFADFKQRAWVALSALASIACAYIIYSGWPFTGTWVLGTFFGLYLFFHGMSQVQIGLAGRRLFPTPV
jgi:uncharacterized membrane protein HdeD (DUF308 family)